MPASSVQENLAVLQQLVAFAEGDTLSIPVPILAVGDGILAGNHVTNRAIAIMTRPQREALQVELRTYLRGAAHGHAVMIAPLQMRMTITTSAPLLASGASRRRRPTRVANYLFEGTARDWVFSLVDRVLPRVAIEALHTCPGCERALVKVTRKRFCSARCQGRTYQRERRARLYETQKRRAVQ